MTISIGQIKTIIIIAFILFIIIGIIIQLDWFWKKIYPLNYRELIIENSRKYKLDPYLLASIIYVESKFSPEARSHKGALGLMQIMPETGNWIAEQLEIDDFQEEQLFEPETNIKFGSWYLANLSQEFNNNLIVILAAYNAGSGNVNKWLKDWEAHYDNVVELPYPETRNYVNQVLKVYKYYSKLYGLKNCCQRESIFDMGNKIL